MPAVNEEIENILSVSVVEVDEHYECDFIRPAAPLTFILDISPISSCLVKGEQRVSLLFPRACRGWYFVFASTLYQKATTIGPWDCAELSI